MANSPMKWPFGNDLFPEMKTVLDNFWTDTPEFFQRMWHTGTFTPAANIHETDTAYEIELAVPGVNKDDIKISLEAEALVISAESSSQSEEGDKRYARREFSFQTFKRSFPLPESVDTDAIAARCQDGILFLTLPKREQQEPKPSREIKIQ